MNVKFLCLFFAAQAFLWGGDALVVKNGPVPGGLQKTIKFHEEMSMGPERGEKHQWIRPGVLTIDDQGHIYVCDIPLGEIYQYNTHGDFVRQIAGKGFGPGEMRRANFYRPLPKGGISFSLDASGMGKLIHFDENLNFLRELQAYSAGQLIQRLIISPHGKTMGGVYVNTDHYERKMIIKSGVLDDEFEELLLLSAIEHPLPTSVDYNDPKRFKRLISRMIKTSFEGVGIVNYDAAGNGYTALSSKYEVKRWNADFSEAELSFSREYKPQIISESYLEETSEWIANNLRTNAMVGTMVTRKLVDEAIELADLPPALPPIYAVIPTGDGHVLVVHKIDLKTGVQVADLFSPIGKYIGTVNHGNRGFVSGAGDFHPAMVFANNRAYACELNNEGEVHIKRYRYEVVNR